MPNQEEADKFSMKPLEQSPVGYWVDENYQFVWVGSVPVDARILSRIRASVYTQALGLDLNLAINRASAYANARDLDLIRNSTLALNRDVALDSIIDLDLAINLATKRTLDLVSDLDITSSLNSAHNRALDLDFDRNNINIDLDHDHNFNHRKLALELTIDIFTLEERIVGRSPAFEGIRLVKERIR